MILTGKPFQLSLVLIIGIGLTGCVSTKPGKVVDTVREGKEGQVDTTYSVETVHSTSDQHRGDLTLVVKKTPEYKIRYADERVKLKKRGSDVLNWIGAGTSTLISGASLTCFVSDNGPGGNLCFTALIVSVPISALSLVYLLNKEKSEYEITNERITQKTIQKETGRPIPARNELIELTLNDKNKQYYTNERGRIAVNVARDFGMRSLKTPESQVATVTLPERGHTESVSLDPRTWMVPYARLTNETPLHRRSTSRSETLQTLNTGLELRILENRTSWYKVRHSGREGWISALDTEQFWASPNREDPKR